MRQLLGSLFICLFLVSQVYASDICIPIEQAKSIVVELKQKRILEQEVQEYEGLIENLKKQVELLRLENQLLKEQVQLVKEQRDIYKVMVDEKDKEIRKVKVVGFFERVKSFLMGAGVGGVVTLLILY